MRDRFSLGDVGRGGPLVKMVLAGRPPVTAPTRHRERPANVLKIVHANCDLVQGSFAVSLRLQARKKSCSEWPLLNRRLPMVQGRGLSSRSWQGRKRYCNTVELVTVHPLLPIQDLKARAGKEVAGVP